jgi:hypothetical protein
VRDPAAGGAGGILHYWLARRRQGRQLFRSPAFQVPGFPGRPAASGPQRAVGKVITVLTVLPAILTLLPATGMNAVWFVDSGAFLPFP